jgi:hypothetical protein
MVYSGIFIVYSGKPWYIGVFGVTDSYIFLIYCEIIGNCNDRENYWRFEVHWAE